MQHEASLTAVLIFAAFVAGTLVLSWWLGRRTKGAAGYFAAHGQIPWFVNGVAFAGDYLSAASFLGICGMIAFYGYDGFLYSIGFLAGWVVALFVIAEPMKRMGKFTFADALDAKFNSKGIKIAAGLSTLAVSIFYLIPQMVGAGALVTPLLGLPHWVGVTLVGGVVIAIVTTAGMVSTTWVQFIKGGLLVVFSTILVGLVLWRGLESPDPQFDTLFTLETPSQDAAEALRQVPELANERLIGQKRVKSNVSEGETLFVTRNANSGRVSGWRLFDTSYFAVDGLGESGEWSQAEWSQAERKQSMIVQAAAITTTPVGEVQYSIGRSDDERADPEDEATAADLPPFGVFQRPIDATAFAGGPAPADESHDPIGFLKQFGGGSASLPRTTEFIEDDGTRTIVFQFDTKSGADLLTPGNHPKFADIKSDELLGKINFLSLMLALFCGTASLPHILIRYYTVKDAAAARKSTIVGIMVIGFFYVLTLYIGLGAMTSGALDPTDSNMAAPLLARSFGEWLFACISAVAFTTVLGTVSGLILASAGAVSHDLMTHGLGIEMDEAKQVRVAKIASVVVGVIAIGLGIAFQGMNVSYLVGWAFSVAASANLPALVCILFWKGTTKQGVIAGVTIGMISSLAWILLSSDTYGEVYGLNPADALTPFTQPGIVTIPLGFASLVLVSLLTKKRSLAH
ncbi:sodium/solute symporter [Alienimonas californiensis]|uniref:Cation/acetate symporter ActP n=1 Tax=Alienimonas californiensis TaxID=2527989 RepID=A0A517P5M9_9PLAN|nr:cation acetate symporter [Alienimonas californiensis]QDT14666.1 Cation/acetate symporter ActP [Alienimonas californiensis]